MRYQSWDVLIFPSGSHIPIQEFDTRFHVLSKIYPGPPQVADDPFVDRKAEPIAQLPLLTSFIASQPECSPFKISIHSWRKPETSISEHRDGFASFQAQVYVDGSLVIKHLFSATTVFPVILASSTLEWPAFKPELQHQKHWDPADQSGRIRLVISEGVLFADGGFRKLVDNLAFSFQHVPQKVLETAGIAWPNPRAFHLVIPRKPEQIPKDVELDRTPVRKSGRNLRSRTKLQEDKTASTAGM